MLLPHLLGCKQKWIAYFRLYFVIVGWDVLCAAVARVRCLFLQSLESRQGARLYQRQRLQELGMQWVWLHRTRQRRCHSCLRQMPIHSQWCGPAVPPPSLLPMPSARAWRRHDVKNCCSSWKLWRMQLPRSAQRCTDCQRRCTSSVVIETLDAYPCYMLSDGWLCNPRLSFFTFTRTLLMWRSSVSPMYRDRIYGCSILSCSSLDWRNPVSVGCTGCCVVVSKHAGCM